MCLFFKYKIKPLHFVYELDCKKHNGKFLQTKEQFFKQKNNSIIYLGKN